MIVVEPPDRTGWVLALSAYSVLARSGQVRRMLPHPVSCSFDASASRPCTALHCETRD